MQLGLLNILANTPAPNALSGAGTQGGGNSAGDMFSQLLGDAGADLGGDTNTQPASHTLPTNDLSTSALIAQEVSLNQTTVLTQTVSPQQATALVGKIDAVCAHLDAQGDAASQQQSGLFQQLKAVLQDVAAGDEPRSVASIVQSVQAQQSAQATQAAIANQQLATPVQRMLAWMQMALKQTSEAPTPAADATEATPHAAPNDVLASLQAATFRAHGRMDAKTAETAKTAADDAEAHNNKRTAIKIIPLSDTTVIPVWTQQPADTQMSGQQLDQAIPPLALNDTQKLPDVSLPSDTAQADAASSQAAAADTQAPAPAWLNNLPFPLAMANEEQLQAAPAPVEQPVDAQNAAPIQAVQQADASAPVATTISIDKAQAQPLAISNNAPLSLGSVGDGQDTKTSRIRGDEVADTAKAADAGSNAANNAVAVTPAQDSHAATNQTANTQNTQQLPAGAHATPAEQVHVAIRAASADGIKHITIQLEPNDLGRVEVSMTTGADGRTHMSFTADKASTLSMLSRDAASLERSLADTGVKADAGSMQFNLRQDQQPQPQMSGNFGQGNQGQGTQAYQNQNNEADGVAPVSANDAAAPTQHYTINVKSGVDIHA